MCFSVQIETDLQKLADKFNAQMDEIAFENFKNLTKANPKKYAWNLYGDQRIYPRHFAPVLIEENGKLLIRPMRYSVRKSTGKDFPSGMNTFNTRLEGLKKPPMTPSQKNHFFKLNQVDKSEYKKDFMPYTWEKIFMKNHGILVFKKFFEWVEDPNNSEKTIQISFQPEDREFMWAPAIWDHFNGSKEEPVEYDSFSIITTEPPSEVLDKGHDRCPVFLKDKNFKNWLNPQGQSQGSLIEMCLDVERPFYNHHYLVA